MTARNVKSNTYVLAGDTTSRSVTLTPEDTNQTEFEVYNAGSSAVFIVSGVTEPTAVFPTSATVPIQGKVCAPGAILSYSKGTNDKYISGITASGTATVYISMGQED